MKIAGKCVPWRVVWGDGDPAIVDGDGLRVARLVRSEWGDEAKADAHLMAAAPEMAALLDLVTILLGDVRHDLRFGGKLDIRTSERIEAAIANGAIMLAKAGV